MVLNLIFAIFPAFPVLFVSIHLDSTISNLKKFAIRVQNDWIYLKMTWSSQFLNDSFAIFSAFPVLVVSIYLDSTSYQANKLQNLISDTKRNYYICLKYYKIFLKKH